MALNLLVLMKFPASLLCGEIVEAEEYYRTTAFSMSIADGYANSKRSLMSLVCFMWLSAKHSELSKCGQD